MTACVALALPLAGQAEPSRFEEQIKYRRSVMTMIKWHEERMAPMLKNPKTFKRDEVLRNATYIEMLSQVADEGFVAGSHEGETQAKPEIWKEWRAFKGLNDDFRREARKLREVATKGEPAAIKTQLGEVNKVCKSCHSDYKNSKL